MYGVSKRYGGKTSVQPERHRIVLTPTHAKTEQHLQILDMREMLMSYTPEEIEMFKLRARIRKLQRDLEHELIQGNLWPPMQDELKQNMTYEIKRLQNRLTRIMETIN